MTAKNKSDRKDPYSYGVMKGKESFKRIYNDALLLMKIAKKHPQWRYISTSCLPRNSIILFAISLEALVNRLLADAEAKLGYSIENERASLKDKLKAIVAKHPNSIGKSIDPKSHLSFRLTDLIKWRDEYVHPKSEIPKFFRIVKKVRGYGEYEEVKLSSIPKDFRDKLKRGIKLKGYGTLGLPSSPTEILMSHAEAVRKLVDDIVNKIDEKLGGYLKKSDILKEEDEAIIYYPDGFHHKVNLVAGLDFKLNDPFGSLDS
jgi:hypothetical protein